MLTVEEIKQTYKELKLSPVNEIYYHINDKQCCPMTALYLKNTGEKLDYHIFIGDIDKWCFAKYGRLQAVSFMTGFDNYNSAARLHDEEFDKEYYELGKQLYLELIAGNVQEN